MRLWVINMAEWMLTKRQLYHLWIIYYRIKCQHHLLVIHGPIPSLYSHSLFILELVVTEVIC